MSNTYSQAILTQAVAAMNGRNGSAFISDTAVHTAGAGNLSDFTEIHTVYACTDVVFGAGRALVAGAGGTAPQDTENLGRGQTWVGPALSAVQLTSGTVRVTMP